MKRYKIAIQKSGRLNVASQEYLSKQGLIFAENNRSLVQPCTNAPIDLLHLRDDDIPEYVSRGVADFGIVGENILRETQAQVHVVEKLGFAHCRLVIAVPKNSTIQTVQDLEGERIATSYPHLLSSFLAQNDVSAAIIPISGSVEITPELNLADAICDLVQTGTTLDAHNLKPLFTILESQALLISSPVSIQDGKDAFTRLLSDL